jgi:hypothetical protein
LFFEDVLGFFAVVPEVRLGSQSVQLLDPLLFSFDVKAASATVRVALRGESVVLWFLPTFLCFRLGYSVVWAIRDGTGDYTFNNPSSQSAGGGSVSPKFVGATLCGCPVGGQASFD